MSLTEQQIRQIIEDTVKDISKSAPLTTAQARGNWLCDTMDEAIASAKTAQQQLLAISLDKRERLVASMRRVAADHIQYLAELAHNETGYGKIPHKVLKNRLAIEKTPGTEDLVPQAVSGDYGLTLVEHAPYGVIGAITPSTNPTSTVINNSISMIAAGNAVVYNPHPGAVKSSIETMRILNEAIISADGPSALICTIKEPSIESGKILMEHPDVPLLTITGGEAVVRVAMRTGKKVIAAGPGNPPVIVDDTAIIEQAAIDIINGASFDNNILCVAEKEVFAYCNIADRLMEEMQKLGAFKISSQDAERVTKVVLEEKDGLKFANKNYVGKDAAKILTDSGVSFIGSPRLIIAEVEESHPFVSIEMMMPVLAIVRVPDNCIETAIQMAIKAENGCRHSAIIHSQNISHLSKAAKALNTSIFVKNAPSYAGLGFGGEGFTTLSIATPTGEGLTSARTFTRERRCVLYGNFRIV